MSERFKFSDGSKMNPYWIYKTMSKVERDICYRLARGGLLGWSKEGLAAAHIKFTDVDPLIEEGVIKRASLFQMATDVVSNTEYATIMDQLQAEGGFLAVESDEKGFIRDFESARKIVEEGETQENMRERFQFADTRLRDYINSLI